MTAYTFDYDLHHFVASWGEKRNFQFPPRDFLPQTGFIIDNTVCGFLYSTDSKLGWIEYVLANPEKSKGDRAEAIDMLFKVLLVTAKTKGIKAIFSASAFDHYSGILESNGFKKTDANMTHFIRLVEGQ